MEEIEVFELETEEDISEEKPVKHKLSKKKKWILAAAAAILLLITILLCVEVKTISVEGNVFYSDSEVEQLLFPDHWSRSPLVIFMNNRLGKKQTIPFVEKYTIRLGGITHVRVKFQEKNMVGYVEFMGSCLYFDKDGMVVESSGEIYGSVPRVTGLDVDYVVLSEKLPVKDETIFQELLQMTQYFSTEEIIWGEETHFLGELVDHIHFDSGGNVSCYLGDIIVSLGSNQHMEGKLREMKDILPQLEGRKGVLYLETYDEDKDDPSYVFKNQQ